MIISKEDIRNKILLFNKNGILKGLTSNERLDCLISQIMDSIERVNRTSNPHNTYFNPICLAKVCKEEGDIDEACFLSFISTHFGEDENNTRWNHVHNVYYGLGSTPHWTWQKTSSDIMGFCQWIQLNKDVLQANGRFGNHRKYEKLDGHTGKTITSYIDWIGKSHINHFTSIQYQVGANPHILFDALYKSMDRVWRFGRTARFDYLCLLGKLKILNIEPGHPYLYDATGPLVGAKLLFGGRNTHTLNNQLRKLGECFDLYFSQQVIEDAVCNWQKSPDNFISFLPATY
ncbi:MAG TPA: hypothetical protein VNY36_03135 [Bacteroidia bacterium]|jgi:hypothetical protein|nr:hypothetical protein [Bacteroidia bacterium]